jgi:hypothetical protein
MENLMMNCLEVIGRKPKYRGRRPKVADGFFEPGFQARQHLASCSARA